MKVVHGDPAVRVSAVRYDSRRAGRGDCFVAVRGLVADANQFVPAALEAGALAVVYDHGDPRAEAGRLGAGATWVEVADSRRALALLAGAAAGHPDREMTMLGVTGTSGKTTTTYLLEAAARATGRRPGVLGTVNARVGQDLLPNPHTTPEAPDTYDLLLSMRELGADLVAMEVSSHALELERVTGVGFDVAVFTNLGRDHLDFHPDPDSYAAAKQRLFESLGEVARAHPAVAVVNADDPRSEQMAAAARRGGKAEVVTFSLRAAADWSARDIKIERTPAGPRTRFLVSGPGLEAEASIRLLGSFNVVNLVGALAAAASAGLPAAESLAAMAECGGAPGRFEVVSAGPGNPTVVVDYAHKPDGLVAVLRTARQVTDGRIVVVFGCGGDRDRGKRPIMGEVVAELAESSWVTSDNPRSEDPQGIIEEILAGLRPAAARTGHSYKVEPDRSAAIAGAMAEAGEQDLVLIAGKGHETYQIFADRTIHFDDREHAREALTARRQATGTASP